MVYQKIAVEVNVKDENDNAPIFNQSASENGMITIEVAENAEIGKRIEMNILRAVRLHVSQNQASENWN